MFSITVIKQEKNHRSKSFKVFLLYKYIMNKGKAVDYLTEDKSIPGQKYCLTSFVSPSGNQKSNILGFKTRGNFDTLAEAQSRAEQMRVADPDFDIYVGQVGLWLPWHPDPSDIGDVQHDDSRLNDIVKGHKESQIRSAQHFEERQRTLAKNALIAGDKEHQAILADQPLHPIVVKTNLHNTRETIVEVRLQLKELGEQLEDLDTQEKDLEALYLALSDEDLEVIREIEHKNAKSGESGFPVSDENKGLFESVNPSMGALNI
jgi:hypothetical protein